MAQRIRTHDWGATPLGPQETWPQSLKSAVEICLASGFPNFIFWGPELIMLYNDAGSALLPDGQPEAFAMPCRQHFADDWPLLEPHVQRVLGTGDPVVGDDIPYAYQGDASKTRWFTVDFRALHDESGAIAGVLLTSFETTAKMAAEAARRESERRLNEHISAARLSADFRVLFETTPIPLAVLEPSDFRIVAVNEAYVRLADVERERLLAYKLFDLFPEIPGDPFAEGERSLRFSLDQVIATRRPHVMAEERYPKRRRHHAVGEYEVGLMSAVNTPVLGPDGSVELIVHCIEDVTERRMAEDALRESEERFRRIVESARDYAIFISDTHGRIVDWLPGAEAVFGWTAEEVLGEPLSITFTPEDRASGVPEMELQMAAAGSNAPDVRWHQRKDGDRVYIEGSMIPLHGRNGGVSAFLKIGQDISERKRAEEHQRMLLNELQHRVRNILAMVRSVVRRTARNSHSVPEYARHIEGRINAMVRTQALLTRDPGTGVDLQNLILDEIQAQAAQDSNFVCEGPDVLLSPKAAEVLTLAIHELATNSTKYGALSRIQGQIAVNWAKETREDGQWIRVTWSESRLPDADPPARQGFGTELITRRVPYELRGRGSIDFQRTKVVATIEFPLGPADSILQNPANQTVH